MCKIKDKIPELQFYQGEKSFSEKSYLDSIKKKFGRKCFIA